MIEFIKLHIGDISYWMMFAAVVGSYIVLHLQSKAREKLFKEYEELIGEHEDVLSKFLAQSIEISSLYMEVEEFVNEHNSWHDRKIAFYYDKDGWHCVYADEIPQGDIVSEQEEINEPNENNDENNQSI
ncbi:hypothetical protein [Ruminococcus sp.]|uniref:hypothetical protein n=1 Tax=Ruminococcus sp. TaxID=41978 RepID=UPI003F01F01C